MSNLFLLPFQPIESSAPGFNSSLGSSGIYALESTGVREWQFPTSRAVQIASKAADDFFIKLGSSDVTCSSTNGILVLGGTQVIYRTNPNKTSIAVKSSTDVAVNVCIGYGN